MYETFEHTADLGLRACAADLPTLFAEAGRALVSVLVDDVEAVRPLEETELRVEGTDREYLLFDWLNELLYQYESRRMLFSEFGVSLDETGLTARLRGEPLDPRRHQPSHEVKAITYHGLKVIQTGDGWLAEVIVDI